MNKPLIYRDTLVIFPVSILSGETVSDIIDLSKIEDRGAMAIRAIGFPENWISGSDITFKCVEGSPKTLYTCDNAFTTPVVISGAVSSSLVGVQVFFTDFLRKIQIYLSAKL